MAVSERYLSQLRDLIKEDMAKIRANGMETDPLGTLLFKVANGDFSSILACGENGYKKFEHLGTKGQAKIASLRRFLMEVCDAIFYRKTRDCGFFKDGITYEDGPANAIITWEELLTEYMWGKNPEFAYRIERIHRP